MDRICQTCGDGGYRELQLYCSKCQISMEHRYCLAKIPDLDDEEFKYICEICKMDSIHQTSSTQFAAQHAPVRGPEHLVKSMRPRKIVASATLVRDLRKNYASRCALVNKAEENVENAAFLQDPNKRLPNGSSSLVTKAEVEVETYEVLTSIGTPMEELSVKVEMPQIDVKSSIAEEEEQKHVVCPFPQTLASDLLVKDLPLLKRKRRLILNQSDESDEEIPCTRYKEPQAALKRKRRLVLDESDEEIVVAAAEIPLPPNSHRDYAQPVVDPTWRGCFEICGEKHDGVVAHLSSNVCSKVVEVSKLMPGILSAEMVSRLDAWPNSFHVSAPTDDNIALYFFPENESAIKTVLFHELVNNFMDLDLALKVLFEDAELLIYPSNQLPQRLWRFSGKYYLWGVFKGRTDVPTLESGDDSHSAPDISNRCYMPPPIGTNKDTESLRMRPLLPSGNKLSFSPDSPRTGKSCAKVQKANAETDSCTLPTSSNLARTAPVRKEMFGKHNCDKGEIPINNMTSTSTAVLGSNEKRDSKPSRQTRNISAKVQEGSRETSCATLPLQLNAFQHHPPILATSTGTDIKRTEMFGKDELPTRNVTSRDNIALGANRKSELAPPRSLRTEEDYAKDQKARAKTRWPSPLYKKVSAANVAQHPPTGTNDKGIEKLGEQKFSRSAGTGPCLSGRPSDSSRIREACDKRQKASAQAGSHTLPPEPTAKHVMPVRIEGMQAAVLDQIHGETLISGQNLKMNALEAWISAKFQTLSEPVNQVRLNSPTKHMNSLQVPAKVVNQVPNSMMNSDSKVTAIVESKQKTGKRVRFDKKFMFSNEVQKKKNQPNPGKKPNQEKLGKKNKQGPCYFCRMPGHKRNECREWLKLLEEQKKYMQSLVPEIRIVVQQPPYPLCMDRVGDNNFGAHSWNVALDRRQPPLPLREAPINVQTS